MTGEESLSIVRRGRWCWKYYKPLDPTGRWPGEIDWLDQLSERAKRSRTRTPPLVINPVRRWFPCCLIAVSRFIPSARPVTRGDVDYLRYIAPKWLGDITAANIVIMDCGPVAVPVLIDFCVNRV